MVGSSVTVRSIVGLLLVVAYSRLMPRVGSVVVLTAWRWAKTLPEKAKANIKVKNNDLFMLLVF